jgi:hypothetical protein
MRFCTLCTPVSSCKHKQAIKTFNKWASWCEAKYKRKRHCHCGIFGIGSVGSVRGEAGLMAESTEQYNHYTNLLTAVSPSRTRTRHLRCSTGNCSVHGDNGTDAAGQRIQNNFRIYVFPLLLSFLLSAFLLQCHLRFSVATVKAKRCATEEFDSW